jgi:hypothetical protein
MMPTGRHMGHRALNNAEKARMARANASAARLAPIVRELQANGVTSLNAIADALNERGEREIWSMRHICRAPNEKAPPLSGGGSVSVHSLAGGNDIAAEGLDNPDHHPGKSPTAGNAGRSLNLRPVHQVGSHEKRHDKKTNGDRLSHLAHTDNANH